MKSMPTTTTCDKQPPSPQLVIKVDVIIAVYNAESTIEETVRSAMHQVLLIPDDDNNDGLILSGVPPPTNVGTVVENYDDDASSSSNNNGNGGNGDGGNSGDGSGSRDVHFDICICCYNDASTDKSYEILTSLQKEQQRQHQQHQLRNTNGNDETISESTTESTATTAYSKGTNMQQTKNLLQTKLLIGTAPSGTMSRGAGYARNQAVKLRDDYEAEQKKRGRKNANNHNQCARKHQQHDGDNTSIHHFLCILDSDDIMHSTRIIEQSHAMLSLPTKKKEHETINILMGCQFDRIPNDSTLHYTNWANSLSEERLYLEQFRECTLLQPTWFLSKMWFEQLGGYLEAPAAATSTNNDVNVEDDNEPANDNTSSRKRIKIDSDIEQKPSINKDAKRYYRLIHPSEIHDSTICNNNNATTATKKSNRKKRKTTSTTNTTIPAHGEHKPFPPPPPMTTTSTLRLAEDTRFFYAHLRAGGRLHLHRSQTTSISSTSSSSLHSSPSFSPLVSYRHRSGMSQSSNTPRKLLLKLRARAWEELVFYGNNNVDTAGAGAADGRSSSSSIANENDDDGGTKWATLGFCIWGAGRDGKDFLKALSPAVASKVVCFVDVDEKKIREVKWYENPQFDGGRRIPILHFSVLAKDNGDVKEEESGCGALREGGGGAFGRIEKHWEGNEFDIVSKGRVALLQTDDRCGEKGNTTPPVSTPKPKKKETKRNARDIISIDPEILRQLPVVVCVAMYRTNGALESNVTSIGRVEGKDLWHIM